MSNTDENEGWATDKLQGDNRPPVYLDKELDRLVFRASGLGSCPRHLLTEAKIALDPSLDLEHTRTPKPFGMKKAAQMGTDFEPVALEWLMDMGFALEVAGSEGNNRPHHDGQFLAEINIGKKAMVRGHVDGVAELPNRYHEDVVRKIGFSKFALSATGNCKAHHGVVSQDMREAMLVEVKQMNEERFGRYLEGGLWEFPGYALQASIYMRALGLKSVLYVVGLRGMGGLDKLVFGKNILATIYQAKDPYFPPFADVMKRVLQLTKAAHGGEELPCNGGSFFCPFKESACDADKLPKSKTQQVTEATTGEAKREIELVLPTLIPLFDKRRDIEREFKALEDEKKALTADLDKMLKELGKAKDKASKAIEKALLKAAEESGETVGQGDSVKAKTGVAGLSVSSFPVARFDKTLALKLHPELEAINNDPACYTTSRQIRITDNRDKRETEKADGDNGDGGEEVEE